MLRTLTVDSFEIDSPEEAAAEILEKISRETLLTNSIGIISCHQDFLYSGAVKAICSKLPFPVVGATSTATATNNNQGFDLLSLFVITSDTVFFTPVLTDSLLENPQDSIAQAYTHALQQIKTSPSLILTYAPFLPSFEGVRMVSEINKVSNGVPLFGTIGVDSTNNFSHTHTIFNGEHYRDRGVLVLINGDIKPKFFVIAISEDNTANQKGIITNSEGCILKSINDLSCLDYMASIGLCPNDGLEGVTTIPFLVDYHDGSPPAGRAIYTFTPEEYIICGGEMPTNASLSIGKLDALEVNQSSEKLMKSIIATNKANGLLVISCFGRSLALGVEAFAEIETVRGVIGNSVPLHMSYSGGEICPVYTDKTKTVNRFHNFTLVVCVF